MSYLLEGLPRPVAAPDGLDAPYWEGLRNETLKIQRCQQCGAWQWGAEWICHQCHSDDVVFEEVAPRGTIYSYERVWHPVHPALKEQGAYVVVLVTLDGTDARVVGNLLGDPEATVNIGAPVRGVFEHHEDGDPAYTLLQWERVE